MTAAVAGAVLATLALTTTAAYADDAIQVDLNGVSGNTNAGAFFVQQASRGVHRQEIVARSPTSAP